MLRISPMRVRVEVEGSVPPPPPEGRTDSLLPINLTDQGHAVKITGRVFVHRTCSLSGKSIVTTVGSSHKKASNTQGHFTAVAVAGEAVKIFNKSVLENVDVQLEVEDTGDQGAIEAEDRQVVTVGVLLILKTSTGCLLASEMLDNWVRVRAADNDAADPMIDFDRAVKIVATCAESLLVSSNCCSFKFSIRHIFRSRLNMHAELVWMNTLVTN
jgi:hypothetical protein